MSNLHAKYVHPFRHDMDSDTRYHHHGASRPAIGGNMEMQPNGHRGTLVHCVIECNLARFV